MTTKQHWGRKIRERRKALGISQSALARRLENDAATVYRWERGITAPHPDMQPRIAEALEIAPEILFDYPEVAAP